jgi:hypothetical protein
MQRHEEAFNLLRLNSMYRALLAMLLNYGRESDDALL